MSNRRWEARGSKYKHTRVKFSVGVEQAHSIRVSLEQTVGSLGFDPEPLV